MPVISEIKADGSGDFSTLQQWADWAATQSNPAQWARVWNLGNPGPVILTGWAATPTSFAFPKIYAAEREIDGTRHDGTDGVGTFIESSTQPCIENDLPYLQV